MSFLTLAAAVTLAVNMKGTPLATYDRGIPAFGYVADPQVGGEEAILACRKAGAWAFRTKRTDERTFAFLKEAGLKAIVVLEGDPAKARSQETLDRLSDLWHRHLIAGIQLGTKPMTAADVAKWERVSQVIPARLKNCPLAIPVNMAAKDPLAAWSGKLKPITHLAVDLTKVKKPLAVLAAFGERLDGGAEQEPDVARLKVWAVAPAISEPVARAAWLVAATGLPHLDAVFFDQKSAADGFGTVMQDFAMAFQYYPILLSRDPQALVLADIRRKIACLVAVNRQDEPLTVTVGVEPSVCMDLGVRRRMTFGGKTPQREALGFYLTAGQPFETTLPQHSTEVSIFGVKNP